MSDRREAILVQLLAVLATTIGAAERNNQALSETRRPIGLLYDSDEEADENDPRDRPANSPRRVMMTPEIYVLLGAKTKDIGTVVNDMRARVIKAIVTDAMLAGLCSVGRGGSISYDGMATTLAQGRQRDANMSIGFSFRYVLNPADL